MPQVHAERCQHQLRREDRRPVVWSRVAVVSDVEENLEDQLHDEEPGPRDRGQQREQRIGRQRFRVCPVPPEVPQSGQQTRVTGTCFVIGLRNVTRIPAIMLTSRLRSLTHSEQASSSMSSNSRGRTVESFGGTRGAARGPAGPAHALPCRRLSRPTCGRRAAMSPSVNASRAESGSRANGPRSRSTRRRNGPLTRVAASVSSASRVTSSTTGGSVVEDRAAEFCRTLPDPRQGLPAAISTTGSVVSTPHPPSSTIFGR